MASLNFSKERMALITGLLAGLSMLVYLSWMGAQAQAKVDKALKLVGSRRSVVIARRHVPVGGRLQARDTRSTLVVGQDIEPGAVSKVGEAVGQMVSQDIYAGEQILRSHLENGFMERAAGAIAPGKSAMAITRDDIAAAPTGIVPGDTVDVFGFDDSGGYGRRVKSLLVRGLGGMSPFAHSRKTGPESDIGAMEPTAVQGEGDLVVEVESWQAETLSAMAEAGKLRVSLRSSHSRDGGN